MRRPTVTLLFALLTMYSLRPVWAAPPDAATVLAQATARASASKKSLLVLFHASWCGWCRRLQTFSESPAAKPILAKYFEIVWLDVHERGAGRAKENPGAAALMGQLGGATSGLPFFAVLDSKGKTLATSINPTNARNIGCPESLAEIGHFQSMVKAGAPAVTAEELATLRQGLERKIIP
jgi:thiol-disulfide isomerase/thioredoxin